MRTPSPRLGSPRPPPFLTRELAEKLAKSNSGEKLDTSKGGEEWQGVLVAGGAKLRLVLRLAKEPNGGWVAELVSVDQGNVTLPVDKVDYHDTVMRLEVKSVGGSFEGEVKGNGTEVAGQWKQG